MNSFLQSVIIDPFNRIVEKFLLFLPNILSSLAIFILGIVLGFIFKILFFRFFHAIRLDKFSARSGIVEVIHKGGVRDPLSLILAKIIGWLMVISFTFLALRSLQLPAVEQILEKFILYLPHVFAAIVILFFGYLLSNFLGRTALIAAVNAGAKFSGLIGRLVKLIIFLLALTMALEQLGIGRETIVITFAIVFGGVVLALSIAFGLGGRDIAREYLEKKIKGEEKKDEISHL